MCSYSSEYEVILNLKAQRSLKRRRHLKWASSDRVSDEQLWEMRIEGKETHR